MSPRVVERIALSALVANVLIVITGVAVRLTGSGLGCPTFPKCTDQSYVATSAMGGHGAIEFGNRMLSLLVGAVTLAVVIAAWRRAGAARRDLRWLSVGLLGTVLAQGLLGGVTVLTGLNPWTVAAHFLMSMGALVIAHSLWLRSRSDVLADDAAPPMELKILAWLITGASAITLILGTLVTGSGPHAGDEKAARTGLDPGHMTQLHAQSVWVLIALSVAGFLALRALRRRHAARAALVLLGVEVAQGAIGAVQYATGLPVLLVAAHVAGACLLWLATLNLLSTTLRSTQPHSESDDLDRGPQIRVVHPGRRDLAEAIPGVG